MKGSSRQQAIKKVLRAIERWPTDHPSIAHLATATKLSERTVQYALRDAEEAGLVKVSYSVGRGLANTYYVPLVSTEKVQRKGASLHPLRRSTSYFPNQRRLPDQSSTDPSRRRAVAGTDSTPLDEPPWWMLRVGKPGDDEEWPRDAEGRRLALLEGKCFTCGQPLTRYSGGQVIPPRGLLIRFPGATKDVPVHMPGGCAGSRPGGPGFVRIGDIIQEQAARSRARLQP